MKLQRSTYYYTFPRVRLYHRPTQIWICWFGWSLHAEARETKAASRSEERLAAAHRIERDKWLKMKKEIGHTDYDKAWQGGRVSGLALALEVVTDASPLSSKQ